MLRNWLTPALSSSITSFCPKAFCPSATSSIYPSRGSLLLRNFSNRSFSSNSIERNEGMHMTEKSKHGLTEHELHDVEHGHHTEIKGLYDTPVSHHGDPRDHLFSDGTRRWEYTADTFHWDEYWANVPKQEIVIVNGQKMIKGVPTRPMDELFCTSQKNLPFWARNRLNIWGNYPLILKAEFLFFWIPTAIIWSLAIPCFTMIYMMDEAIHTTMTVKVIGRQWYWLYEVESPPEDDDE